MLLRSITRGLTRISVRAQRSSLHTEPFVDPLNESARSALAKSCYLNIDWTISKEATVAEAVARMVGENIGALAVEDEKGEIVGIVSERDYLCKVGILGKKSSDTKGTKHFSPFLSVTP